MSHRVLFLHSSGPQDRHEGSGEFVARLEDELGEEFEVRFPKMPDPDDPHYEPWRDRLREELAALEGGPAVLIGHSLGGSTILKYLCEGGSSDRIQGVLTIATPFWRDEGWEAEYALPASTPSGLPPIFLFHSRDDEEIPFSHLELYAKRFPDASVHLLDGNGHLFDRGGLSEIVKTVRSLAA